MQSSAYRGDNHLANGHALVQGRPANMFSSKIAKQRPHLLHHMIHVGHVTLQPVKPGSQKIACGSHCCSAGCAHIALLSRADSQCTTGKDNAASTELAKKNAKENASSKAQSQELSCRLPSSACSCVPAQTSGSLQASETCADQGFGASDNIRNRGSSRGITARVKSLRQQVWR